MGAAGEVCGPYSQTDCVGFKRLAPGYSYYCCNACFSLDIPCW